MDPTPREAAAEKLRVRAERLRAIRRRVWATALATFVIAFGVIGVSGSMGHQTSAVAQTGDSSGTAASSDTGTSSASSDDTGGWGTSSSSSDDGSSSSSAGSPMTTRQS